MYCDSSSVTSPSAKTPIVWVTVTVAPSPNACRAVPRVPIRYAATIALPCPGESACSAPQPNAARSRSSRTPSPEAASPNTPVSPSLPRLVVVVAPAPGLSGASSVPPPGRTVNVARR